MANNLRLFNTNSEYQSADLVYPAVSYVIETDKVHYDYTPPTPPVFQGKFKATYSGGETYELDCDGRIELTSGNTKPSGYQYSAMTEAIIGNCVQPIGFGAFYKCESLTSITMADSVDWIMDYAFRECKSLTSVTIPSAVGIISQQAFALCTSLTSIDIPSGVGKIDNQVFYGCRNLTNVTVNATTPPRLGSQAFEYTNDCPIYVPSASVDAYKAATNWSSYASRIQPIP